MKVAIDTCVGKRGRALLELAGHTVVVEAENAEPDHDWFARAKVAGVEIVISSDSDLEIICWDSRVRFYQAKQGCSGEEIARRFLWRYPGNQDELPTL